MSLIFGSRSLFTIKVSSTPSTVTRLVFAIGSKTIWTVPRAIVIASKAAVNLKMTLKQTE